MRRLLNLGVVLLLVGLAALTVGADRSSGAGGRSATIAAADPATTASPTAAPTGTSASTVPQRSGSGSSTAGATSAGTGSASAATVTAVSTRCRVRGPATDRGLVRQLARLCVSAARTVDRAWGTAWRRGTGRHTRLVVAADVSALADLLGHDDTDGLTDVAAVTTGPVGEPARAVYINGDAFAALSDLGRSVVLTHELVHVATRATGDQDAPTWVEEGYADYVAYRDSGLDPDQIAGDALAAALPTEMLGTADFDASEATAAAVAYGRAWAAVGLVADRLPTAAGLRRFYRIAAHQGQDAALRFAGFAQRSAFVKAWRRAIVGLRAQ